MNSNTYDQTPSRIIASAQEGVHERLESTVTKHLATNFGKPISKFNSDNYDSAMRQINREKIIFDSGCGNGRSTFQLARNNPDAFVIGIDKSAARLSKSRNNKGEQDPSEIDNYCLVRADLIDFLRLASNDGIALHKHYFLYPNPWPKSQHLQRRWHGSPVFKDIIQLGGVFEVRSNWKIYAEEFKVSLGIAGITSMVSEMNHDNHHYISDFEAKYHRSGQALWQLLST
ncbi:methyltransferase domain-containing protein [Pseudomonadales bacterium]|nr:methyltransferase domain-containing protein [Pseudomonadales bacterium]